VPVASARGDKRTLEVLLTARDQTKATLRRMQSQVRSTSRIVTSSFTRAAGAAKALQSQIFNLRNALVLGVGAAMTKFTADFEDGLAQIAGLLDDPDQWMKGFDRGIRDIAIETGDSFDSLTKSLFDTLSASVPAEHAMSTLAAAARLASAGGTDTATAVDGLTSLLKAYSLEATEAARLTDLLFQGQKKGKTTIAELSNAVGQVAPLANTIGVKIEEVIGALASLTAVGLSTDEAATQLKAFFTALIRPSAQAKTAAREFGIELDASALSGGRFVKFLQGLQEATGGSVKQLGKLFVNTRALQGAIGLSRNGARDFADTMQAMSSAAGSVNKAFAITNNTLGAKLRRTWRGVQASITLVIKGMRPLISGLLDSVRDFFARLNRADEEVVAVFRALSDVSQSAFRTLKEAWKNNDVWQLVTNGAIAMVSGLVKLFAGAIPKLSRAALDIGSAMGSALLKGLIGATKEELVGAIDAGGFKGFLAGQLISDEDYEDAKEKLAEIERLKQLTTARGRKSAFGIAFDLDSAAARSQIQSQAEEVARLLKEARDKVFAEQQIQEQWYGPDQVRESHAQAIREVERLEDKLQDLRRLQNMSQEELTELLRKREMQFLGSEQASERAIAAQQRLYGEAKSLSDQLKTGVADGTAQGIDETMSAVDRLRSAFKSLGKALGDSIANGIRDAVPKGIGEIFKGGKAAEAAKEMERLGEAQDKLQEQLRDRSGWAGAKAAVQDYIKGVRDSFQQYANLTTSVVGTMQSSLGAAFVSIARRTRDLSDAFRDMAMSILNSVQQILSNMLAGQIISGILGAFVSSAGIGATAASDGIGGIGGSIGAPVPATLGSQAASSGIGGLGGSVGGPTVFGAGLETGGGYSGPQEVTNYNITINISALDGRSVERVLRDNKGLITALTVEQMDDSPSYREKIKRVAR
jgi:TP901 family phage tail tape measure protein/lambda family phage tail tape measure protein